MKVGDTVVIITVDLWFPSGVVQQGRLICIGQHRTSVVVRCKKRRCGFLWNVYKDFTLLASKVIDVIPPPTKADEEIAELRRIASLK